MNANKTPNVASPSKTVTGTQMNKSMAASRGKEIAFPLVTAVCVPERRQSYNSLI
jgi:hypothetical protein